MFKKIRAVVSLLALGGLMSTVGCGADLGDASASDGESGLESVQEELGESGCGSVACTDPNSCRGLEINQCGAPSFARTAVPPYGSASCPSQTIAEDTTPPTAGGRILPMVQWRGAALTAANCASAKIESALYAKVGAASAATLVGVEVYKGVWSDSSCAFTSTTSKPFVTPSPNLKAVRSTARAVLGTTQQAVATGFWQVCP